MKNSNAGFALIIALGLMSFVVLLILSLGILASVETQTTSIKVDQEKARQNALLGMGVALGKLQSLAGPDQRVTATADIIYDDTTFGTDGSSVVNNNWVGVWSSKEDLNNPLDAAVGLDNRDPVWLVSGGSGQNPTSLGSGEAVELVSSNDGSGNQRDSVVVLTEEAVGNGRFGYWISDEGVKAKITTPDRLAGSTEADLIDARVLVAQNTIPAAVKNASGGATPYDSAVWNTEAAVGVLDSTVGSNSLALALDKMGIGDAGALSEALYENYHDFTTVGRSLITDVRNGGFRGDLTTAFRSDSQFNGFRTDRDDEGKLALFEPKLENDIYDPGGPLWDQFYAYYSNRVPASGAMDFREPTNDDPGFFPVVSRYQWVVTAFAVPVNEMGEEMVIAANQDRHNVYGLFCPVVTLWNPYNVDMDTDQLYLEMTFNGVAFGKTSGSSNYPSVDPVVLFKDNGVTGVSVIENDFEKSAGRSDRFVMRFTIPPLSIRAGESVTLGSAQNRLADDNDNNQLVPIDYAPVVRGYISYTTVLNVTKDQLEGRGAYVSQGGYAYRPQGTLFNNDQIRYGFLNLYHEAGDYDREDRILSYDIGAFWPGGGGWKLEQGIKVINPSAKPPMNLSPPEEDPDPDGEVPGNVPQDLEYRFTSSENPVGIDHPEKISPSMGMIEVMAFPGAPESSAGVQLPIYAQTNVRAVYSPRPPHEHRDVGGAIFRDQNLVLLNPQFVTHDNPNHLSDTGFFDKGFAQGNSSGYTGFDYRGEVGRFGTSESVLFDVPREDQELLSIAELSHGSFFRLPDNINGLKATGNTPRFILQNVSPNYAIGNSYADLYIPLDSTKVNFSEKESTNLNVTNGEIKGAHYDYSYLLNEVLWDRYYFSGVPSGWGSAADGFSLLSNSRLVAWEESVFPVSSSSQSGRYNNFLSKFYVNGGFNVNSTSVDAWIALLSSFRGLDLPSNAPNGIANDGLHTYTRSLTPRGAAINDNQSVSHEENYATYRRLSDQQIVDLAIEIVDGIKERRQETRESGMPYPFLSLSEFVNRSIDSMDFNDPNRIEHTYSGVIQAAIDATNINEHITTEEFSQDGRDASAYFTENLAMIEERNLQAATPGYLMQADVLSRIGPVLNARSDTFKIRAYGDVRDLTGTEVTARAYCEATVQRLPDWIDSSDLGSNDINGNGILDPFENVPSGGLNERLGRQFVIVDFVWLDPSQI